MSKIDDVMKQAALLAGDIVMKSVPHEGASEKEGRVNFVTATDLASEKAIIDLISHNFPGHKILAEETSPDVPDPLNCDNLWVIDPIDGTNNFLHHRGYSAISIAYVEKGTIKSAAAYNPYLKEMFTAQKGQGAYLNGTRIHTGDAENLSRTTVATDNSSHAEGTKHNLGLMLKVEPTPWYLMRGSAVLTMCDVAAARIDLYFHTSLKPWDNAAAFLIAEESGATLLGIDGQPTNFLSSNVVLGNQKLVEQFLKAIN